MTDTDRFQASFEARVEARLQARADLATRPFDDLGIARDAMAVARRRRSWWPGPRQTAAVRPAPHRGWVVLVVLLVALVAGALVVGSQLLAPSPPLPIPADHGLFTPTGSMAVTRQDGFTATRLRDGLVAVMGGGSDVVEIWDPATEQFGPAGFLTQVRTGNTATLLEDGRVLVVGGDPGGVDGLDGTAETWDPATGVSSPTGSLSHPRTGHTATLLRDGRVLVVGGQGVDSPVVAAETWDPVTGVFSAAGSLIDGRDRFTATRLDGGRVMVTGGATRDPASAEIWDPATEAFERTGSLTVRTQCPDPFCSIEQGRMLHSATLLDDGRVLVIGGVGTNINSVARDVAELWDARIGRFSAAGHMAQGRQGHTATLLPDGRVLVTGGSDAFHFPTSRQTAEIWDPATSTFSPTGSLTQARTASTATLLLDGRVLVIGGEDNHGINDSSGSSAELFDLQR